MIVDILCRVVDNLGDIGFVYRLARALSGLSDPPRLRLVVDDLAAFAGICPAVKPDESLQFVEGWLVARWDNPGEAAMSAFCSDRPRFVLECYACGRPDWFESILFDEGDPVPRTIVNLEYLTAESWARDFHRLPSLTRSALVRKVVFMPGFQSGTGGLLQDTAFSSIVKACESLSGTLSVCRAALTALGALGFPFPVVVPESAFRVFIFSYEHDFSAIIKDLAVFNTERPVFVLVAAGRSSAPFLDAWNRAGCPFPVLALPLLPQTLWDEFLCSSDFAIVRGEESLSRACLSGHPFLWQCYPFAQTPGVSEGESAPKTGGQLPKVTALLDLIKPFLNQEDFAAYERLTLAFNGASVRSLSGEPPEPEPGDLLRVLRATNNRPYDEPKELSGTGILAGFSAWSAEVRNLGNLAANLLTFMRVLR